MAKPHPLLFSLPLLGLDVLLVLGICAEQLVPPHEAGGIVTIEVLVMEVMETCTCGGREGKVRRPFRVPSTSISWDEVERVEVREVIAAVHIYGLQEAHGHPCPYKDEVVTEAQDTDHEAHPENCRGRRGGGEGNMKSH